MMTPESQKQQLENLTTLFLVLKHSETALHDIIEGIKNAMVAIDKLIGEHLQEWHQHDSKFAEELITALEQQGLTLSEFEKTQLRQGLKSLGHFKNSLGTSDLVLPERSSFTIKVYATIVAALARNLQNHSNVTSIAKKLKVIAKEQRAAATIRDTQQTSYQAVTTATVTLQSKIEVQQGLRHDQKTILAKLKEVLSSTPRPTKVQPLVPALEIKND